MFLVVVMANAAASSGIECFQPFWTPDIWKGTKKTFTLCARAKETNQLFAAVALFQHSSRTNSNHSADQKECNVHLAKVKQQKLFTFCWFDLGNFHRRCEARVHSAWQSVQGYLLSRGEVFGHDGATDQE